jgi:rhodanese-related sulfurtransferase
MYSVSLWKYVTVLAVRVAVILIIGSIGSAQSPTTQSAPQNVLSENDPGPYCGIYALFGGLKKLGFDVRLASLVTPEYIGSRNGSSLEELERAALASGASATPISGLTTSTLVRLSQPAILHVLSASGSGEYDHWILFCGSNGNDLEVFDPAHRFDTLSIGKLAEIWDGTGLILGRKHVTVGLAPILSNVNLYIGIAALFLSCVYLNARWLTVVPKIRLFNIGTIRQSALILLISITLGTVWHSFTSIGLLARPEAGDILIRESRSKFLPNVSAADVRESVAHNSRLWIIDARYEQSYRQGHLPGAIDIPVDTSLQAMRNALVNANHSDDIVVYCQSKTCAFAKAVARKLFILGYQNVKIMPGGWEEWKQ